MIAAAATIGSALRWGIAAWPPLPVCGRLCACVCQCVCIHACMYAHVLCDDEQQSNDEEARTGLGQCLYHGHTSVSSPWPHISVLTMATQCPHHGHTVSLPWPLSVLTMATHQCPHHGHTKKGLLKRVCSRLHFGHKSTHNPGAHTNTHTHTHIYTHTQTKRLTKTRLQSFTFWPQEHT